MERKSVFTVQSFAKEPTANGTTRLQSFRPPRDLSLGGTKPKKLYAPNLNVTRLKNKQKEVPVKEIKKNVRTHEAKPSVTHTGNRNKFVQLQGVFSEGSGGDARRNVGYGFSENRASYKSHDLPVPKVRKRGVLIKDAKIEDGAADDLLRDSGGEEDGDDVYAPFKLNPEDIVTRADCKKEGKVKMDESFNEEFVKSEQYSDSNICFSLLQFPDSVASKVLNEGASGTDVKLNSVGEGKIGKIVIRQSGKMELHIGSKVYEMSSIRGTCFVQDVVATAEENGRRKMGKLGSINLQYMVTPHWEQYINR